MDTNARDDIYQLAALLGEIERIMDPLAEGDGSDFGVDPTPPPPLPPTGSAAGGGLGGGSTARTAQEWARIGGWDPGRRGSEATDAGRGAGASREPSTDRASSGPRTDAARPSAPDGPRSVHLPDLPGQRRDDARSETHRITAPPVPTHWSALPEAPDGPAADRALAAPAEPSHGRVPTPRARRAAAAQQPRPVAPAADIDVDLPVGPVITATRADGQPRPARPAVRPLPPPMQPAPSTTADGQPTAEPTSAGSTAVRPGAAERHRGRGHRRAEPPSIGRPRGTRRDTHDSQPTGTRAESPATAREPNRVRAPAARSGRVPRPPVVSADPHRLPPPSARKRAASDGAHQYPSAPNRWPRTGLHRYDLPLGLPVMARPSAAARVIDIRVPPPEAAFAEARTDGLAPIYPGPPAFPARTGIDAPAEPEPETEPDREAQEAVDGPDLYPPLSARADWWGGDTRRLSEAARRRIAHRLSGRFLDRALRRLP